MSFDDPCVALESSGTHIYWIAIFPSEIFVKNSKIPCSSRALNPENHRLLQVEFALAYKFFTLCYVTFHSVTFLQNIS